MFYVLKNFINSFFEGVIVSVSACEQEELQVICLEKYCREAVHTELFDEGVFILGFFLILFGIQFFIKISCIDLIVIKYMPVGFIIREISSFLE